MKPAHSEAETISEDTDSVELRLLEYILSIGKIPFLSISVVVSRQMPQGKSNLNHLHTTHSHSYVPLEVIYYFGEPAH